VIRAIVTDIEGTTSSLAFVKDVLFPYARARLAEFVRAHAAEPAVRAELDAVRRLVRPDLGDTQAIEQLLAWSDADQKVTPLKALQGMIWETGYRAGDFTGHVYPDAAAALRRWHAAGLKLYVYSSGSVPAQKLLFGFSAAGDLTPLFTGYFDTTIGAKRDPDSYRRVAAAIGLPADEILFLSDTTEELDAAATAGLQTLQLVRATDRTRPGSGHGCVSDFGQIRLGG
jgi:enolase-phosphatase E1